MSDSVNNTDCRLSMRMSDFRQTQDLLDKNGNACADDDDGDGADANVLQTRPSWSRSIDFFMSCLGGSVGLGNVWKFPYLCYKNGGGAFLIPYFLSMLLATLPLFVLEVGIGQYMGAGAHKAWGILPLFQGLGMTAISIIFYMNCYYNTILAWALMYLYHSFASPLPWQSCDGAWNTQHCTADFTQNNNSRNNGINLNNNINNNNSNNNNNNNNNASIMDYGIGGFNKTPALLVDSVTEFWEKKVLNLSEGIHDMGTPKMDLTLCLALAWLLVYLCICKGIKSSGKVMYFTAPAPYVFMVIILIRNATLDGASNGVRFYLKANLTKLSELSVWTDAGKQTFFSNCIAQGILVTLGSYNKFHHKYCRDSILFSFVNAFTSLFAGFLVFTILGFMAFQQGRPIEEVAESGPGLAFIAYPKAVSQMPLPQFWSVAFFIMILLLGLDSQFLGVESVTTNFIDLFPSTLRRGYRKEIFIAGVCLVNFLIGLAFVCRGGMYAFQLVDFYACGKTLLLVGCLEVVAITYFYGIDRFLDNMRMMVGHDWVRVLSPYLSVCWRFLTPAICLMLFVLSVINEDELNYSRPNESVYRYPAWADGIGWLLTASCLVWLPGIALYRFYTFGFSTKVFQMMRRPFHLHPHQMRPQDKDENVSVCHSSNSNHYDSDVNRINQCL